MIKNLYFSGILLLPVSFMIFGFKRLDVRYKYNITLLLLLIIPILPFIKIPDISSNREFRSLIKNEYIQMVEQPLSTMNKLTESIDIEVNEVEITGTVKKRDYKEVLFIILTSIYIIILTVLLIRLIHSVKELKSYLSKSTNISDHKILNLSRDIFRAMNIKKDIRLLTMKSISSPYSFGFFSPVIVFPEFNIDDTEEFKQILIHEAEHIRRGDYLTTCIQRLFEVVLFYNPLIWLLSTNLSTYRELICDRRVIDMHNNTQRYIKTLLDTAKRNLSGVPLICNGTVSSKKTLNKRVENIFNDPKKYNRKFSLILKVTLTAIVCSILITLGCVNTSPENGELPISVQEIKKEIFNLEKTEHVQNIETAKIDKILTQIDTVEKKLKKRNDNTSKRGLAYLLLYRADMLHLSQIGHYGEDEYWKVMGQIVLMVKEAMEIIEEYGSANDKGEIYYHASNLYYADSLENLKKAHTYFKEAENRELSAYTTLLLVNKSINQDGINIYREDLNSAKKWGDENNDFKLLSILRGLDYYQDKTFDDVYRRINWSGFTLERVKDHIGYESGNIYTYGQPREITKLNDIFGIHWTLTGTFSKPIGSSLNPYDGITSELLSLESGINIVTENKTYTDVQKIIYDVKVDEKIYDRDSWYRLLEGLNIFYYKKGVGIIQYENSNEGTKLFLSHVDITESSDSYLPLNVGNYWTYSVTGYSDDIISHQYKVEYITNNKIYFSSYGFEKFR